ncbi:MAG: hypothetical protein ACYDBJ_27445 [Aggregatilineales bacterium]
MALQQYTLYLDDEDPDDIPFIRYLNRYKRKRKVSNELRNAVSAYLRSLKTSTAFVAVSASTAYEGYEEANAFQAASIGSPALVNGVQAGTTKAIQEARRTFRR